MEHTSTEKVIAAHRHATRILLQAAMEHFKAECPTEYRHAADAVRCGSHFLVSSALSPAGLDELMIDLVTPTGDRINLMHVENDDTCLAKKPSSE